MDQDSLGHTGRPRGDGRGDRRICKGARGRFQGPGVLQSRRATETVTFNKLSGRHGGKQHVRDLWRQKDMGDATGTVQVTVPARGRAAET